MRAEELKHRLGLILLQEEKPEVDWATVASLSANLADELGAEAPGPVQEYLAGVEQRRTDSVFAHAQRSDLIHFLRDI